MTRFLAIAVLILGSASAVDAGDDESNSPPSIESYDPNGPNGERFTRFFETMSGDSRTELTFWFDKDLREKLILGMSRRNIGMRFGCDIYRGQNWELESQISVLQFWKPGLVVRYYPVKGLRITFGWRNRWTLEFDKIVFKQLSSQMD